MIRAVQDEKPAAPTVCRPTSAASEKRKRLTRPLSSPMIIGHGYPPEALERASRLYIRAWKWRTSNLGAWHDVVAHALQAAESRCAIDVGGIVPHEFAAIVRRWLIAEHPATAGSITTHRCIFDVFTG